MGSVGAYAVVFFGAQAWLPRAASSLAAFVLFAILMEGGAQLVLHDALASSDSQRAKLFERLFSGEDSIEAGEGQVLNYAPHPYLGFALSPHASHGII
jgi:hypothetical protein